MIDKQQISMQMLNVYTHRQRLGIELKEQLLGGSLQKLKNYVLGILGYSTQLYLYREPLSTFSRLDFVPPATTLSQILEGFGAVCLTYNNRQHLEEPDFLQPFPKEDNHLMIVAQTCHQSVFSFERYKIHSKSPISFAKSIASRLAREVYVLYYQLRIPINEFSNDEAISSTLGKLAYDSQLVLLTADDQATDQLWQEAHNLALVNFEEYYVIYLEEREIVMSRQAEWQVVVYILSLIFKTPFQVKGQDSPSFTVDKTVNKVTLVRKSTKYELIPSLSLSFFVGQTYGYLVFLEQSCIMHIYSRHRPFQLINSVILCSEPCSYLSEQIPVLLDDQLIMYNITLSCIILKFYSLPLGQLKQARHYKWEKEYRTVQADTLDLIAVSYKGNLIRAFYVYDPQRFLELRQPEADWFILVNKIGYNVLSDRSGLFAIGGKNSQILNIYSLQGMQKVASITLNIFPLKGLSVSFNLQDKVLLVNNEQNCFEIGFTGDMRKAFKKQSKAMIYCYSPSGAIFQATPSTFQWLHSPELRVKSGVLITDQAALSFNTDLQPGSFSMICQQKMNE